MLSTHLFYIAMCRLGLLHVGHSWARQARSPKYLRHTIGTRTLLSQLVTDRGLPHIGGAKLARAFLAIRSHQLRFGKEHSLQSGSPYKYSPHSLATGKSKIGSKQETTEQYEHGKIGPNKVNSMPKRNGIQVKCYRYARTRAKS